MADLMMCDDNNCPHHNTCYRYLAEINEYRQAWFSKSPLNQETGECEYYWEHHPTDKLSINSEILKNP